MKCIKIEADIFVQNNKGTTKIWKLLYYEQKKLFMAYY